MLEHYLDNGGGLIVAGCGYDMVSPFKAAVSEVSVNVFLGKMGVVFATAPACFDIENIISVKSFDVRVFS